MKTLYLCLKVQDCFDVEVLFVAARALAQSSQEMSQLVVSLEAEETATLDQIQHCLIAAAVAAAEGGTVKQPDGSISLNVDVNVLPPVLGGRKHVSDVEVLNMCATDVRTKFLEKHRDCFPSETEKETLNALLAIKEPMEECYKEVGDLLVSPDTMLKDLSFNHVCLGGTFDRLHAGHKLLLGLTGLISAQEVQVGITEAKNMLSGKAHARLIQPYEDRERITRDMLSRMCRSPDVKILTEPLQNGAGPAGYVKELEAIVVSKETAVGATLINKMRIESGLPPLRVVVSSFIPAPSFISKNCSGGGKLSSTALRQLCADKK